MTIQNRREQIRTGLLLLNRQHILAIVARKHCGGYKWKGMSENLSLPPLLVKKSATRESTLLNTMGYCYYIGIKYTAIYGFEKRHN